MGEVIKMFLYEKDVPLRVSTLKLYEIYIKVERILYLIQPYAQ